MRNIIIVGYPKSGTTWLTRLVADLAGCPISGSWNSKENKEARKDSNIKSETQCFKSHNQLYEFDESDNNGISSEDKIIYVIRDPRDVAISGAHYFRFKRWPAAKNFFLKFPRIGSLDIGWLLYTKSFFSSSLSYSTKIEKMVYGILHGSADINHWIRVPWKSHYRPYLKNNYFFVKYEDLLADPENECKKIVDYLGINKQDDQIRDVIERQSFKNKKKQLLKENETRKAKNMRAGVSNQWKNELSKDQKRKFVELLSDDLKHFSYPVDDKI